MNATSPQVLHVIPEYLPRSATFVHTLLRSQTRYEARVVALELSHLDEFPVAHAARASHSPGARIAADAWARLRGLGSWYGRDIAREIERGGCVLVHAHFGWSGRDAVRAAKKCGVPLLTVFYGKDISEQERVSRSRRPGRETYARLFDYGTVFVVEGPAMARHLETVGAPPAKIEIVPIGIDLDMFAFQPRESASPRVVVQSARFVEKKGFDLTLRAFAEARPDLGPSELWLIGDGPLRPELEALVARLGLRDVVRFHGLVSHETYRELVTRADVCVQPSRTAADGDTEGGAPTVILEMQALGVPVVATRHADIPSVVPRPGELVAEEDVDGLAAALVAVATEDDAAREVRLREARAFVERRHDRHVTAAAVEALYDRALR
jgi:glycosyltransferase involved in cell wall biosynthesis